MKLTYVDKNGNPQMIEGFEYISDDDEWLTMTTGEHKKAIHKADIFERTYVVCNDEVN